VYSTKYHTTILLLFGRSTSKVIVMHIEKEGKKEVEKERERERERERYLRRTDLSFSLIDRLDR